MRTHLTIVGAAFLSLAGCSGADSEAAYADGPAPSGRYGLVVLSQNFGEPGVAVSGQIMDFEGITQAEALRALSTPEEVWLTELAFVPGQCQLFVEDPEPLAARAWVDLLDVGSLSIQSPAPLTAPLLIAPHELPPVLATFAGVVYDADAPQVLPYLAHGHYHISAEGAEAGPLACSIQAPPAAWLEGYTLDTQGLSVQIGGGTQDGVIILSHDVGTRTVGLVCAVDHNSPTLQISAGLLNSFGAGSAALTVMHMTKTPLTLDGLDAGDVIFVTRDSTVLRIPEYRAEEQSP